jgi:hypothetical protein
LFLLSPTGDVVGEDLMMAKPILPDKLWMKVEPPLPLESPKPKSGRPRVADLTAVPEQKEGQIH